LYRGSQAAGSGQERTMFWLFFGEVGLLWGGVSQSLWTDHLVVSKTSLRGLW
jgi:hypothetical protein